MRQLLNKPAIYLYQKKESHRVVGSGGSHATPLYPVFLTVWIKQSYTEDLYKLTPNEIIKTQRHLITLNELAKQEDA